VGSAPSEAAAEAPIEVEERGEKKVGERDEERVTSGEGSRSEVMWAKSQGLHIQRLSTQPQTSERSKSSNKKKSKSNEVKMDISREINDDKGRDGGRKKPKRALKPSMVTWMPSGARRGRLLVVVSLVSKELKATRKAARKWLKKLASPQRHHPRSAVGWASLPSVVTWAGLQPVIEHAAFVHAMEECGVCRAAEARSTRHGSGSALKPSMVTWMPSALRPSYVSLVSRRVRVKLEALIAATTDAWLKTKDSDAYTCLPSMEHLWRHAAGGLSSRASTREWRSLPSVVTWRMGGVTSCNLLSAQVEVQVEQQVQGAVEQVQDVIQDAIDAIEASPFAQDLHLRQTLEMPATPGDATQITQQIDTAELRIEVEVHGEVQEAVKLCLKAVGRADHVQTRLTKSQEGSVNCKGTPRAATRASTHSGHTSPSHSIPVSAASEAPTAPADVAAAAKVAGAAAFETTAEAGVAADENVSIKTEILKKCTRPSVPDKSARTHTGHEYAKKQSKSSKRNAKKKAKAKALKAVSVDAMSVDAIPTAQDVEVCSPDTAAPAAPAALATSDPAAAAAKGGHEMHQIRLPTIESYGVLPSVVTWRMEMCPPAMHHQHTQQKETGIKNEQHARQELEPLPQLRAAHSHDFETRACTQADEVKQHEGNTVEMAAQDASVDDAEAHDAGAHDAPDSTVEAHSELWRYMWRYMECLPLLAANVFTANVLEKNPKWTSLPSVVTWASDLSHATGHAAFVDTPEECGVCRAAEAISTQSDSDCALQPSMVTWMPSHRATSSAPSSLRLFSRTSPHGFFF